MMILESSGIYFYNLLHTDRNRLYIYTLAGPKSHVNRVSLARGKRLHIICFNICQRKRMFKHISKPMFLHIICFNMSVTLKTLDLR